MFSPTLGRFISRDPIEADPNSYRYEENNPPNSSDPRGLMAVHGNLAQGKPKIPGEKDIPKKETLGPIQGVSSGKTIPREDWSKFAGKLDFLFGAEYNITLSDKSEFAWQMGVLMTVFDTKTGKPVPDSSDTFKEGLLSVKTPKFAGNALARHSAANKALAPGVYEYAIFIFVQDATVVNSLTAKEQYVEAATKYMKDGKRPEGVIIWIDKTPVVIKE